MAHQAEAIINVCRLCVVSGKSLKRRAGNSQAQAQVLLYETFTLEFLPK